MAEEKSKLKCWYCNKDANGIACLTCMNTSCSQLMHPQCAYKNQDPEASGKVLICPRCSGNNIAYCREPNEDINEDAKKVLGVGGRRKYKKHKKTKKHRKHRKYGKTKKR
jgi:hypothetical protein